MDPLTQGVLGASMPQACSREAGHVRLAAGIGFLSGMAADLDVFIRSSTDPLLFLEYHRQFTHSLIFIPLGGALCALVLHQLFGRQRGFSYGLSWLYCTLGYATHAVLDACTTYGTMLFWPFSDQRVAWNVISVVDPLFTVVLLVLFVMATRNRSRVLARVALAWALIYPTVGMLQRDRAVAAGWELANTRGHAPLRLEAKPSFGNLLLWKIVYETNEKFYVDAVRAGMNLELYEGESVAKLDIDRDLPWLDPGSQQARDIERFRWFSNGYIAKDPVHDFRIIDVRYSMVPNEVDALWSIEVKQHAKAGSHVSYETSRDTSDAKLEKFMSMLFPGN